MDKKELTKTFANAANNMIEDEHARMIQQANDDRLLQGIPLSPPDVRICKTCHGWGSVIVSTVGHRLYGQKIQCPDPECKTVAQQRFDRMQRLEELFGTNIDPQYDTYTLDSFLTLSNDQLRGKVAAAVACKYFTLDPLEPFKLSHALKSFSVPFKQLDGQTIETDGRKMRDSFGNWLFLAGEYGTGKSGLAVSTARQLRLNGAYVLYIRLPDFLDSWRAMYNIKGIERVDYEKRLSRPLVDADVLIIDEFNVAGSKDNRANEDSIRIVMDKIIQPRWAQQTKKPTIMTANLTAKEFNEHWGKRIAQRVFERSHWLTLRGAVLRHTNQPLDDDV